MFPKRTGTPLALFALTWKPAPGVEKTTPRGVFTLKKSGGSRFGAENWSGVPSQLISRRPVSKVLRQVRVEAAAQVGAELVDGVQDRRRACAGGGPDERRRRRRARRRQRDQRRCGRDQRRPCVPRETTHRPASPSIDSLGSGSYTWRLGSSRARSRLNAALISAEVGERLREVAELLAGRADLLGVEAEVVRVAEHLLEGEPRLARARPARASASTNQNVHILNVPSSPRRPSGLRLRVVAVDEAVARRASCSIAVERREPARVVRGDEVDQRHHQERGVEDVVRRSAGRRPGASPIQPRSMICR